jgi:aspartate/methionine/tyrosine aminotransferase
MNTSGGVHLTNTEYERLAIDEPRLNLSDGHARFGVRAPLFEAALCDPGLGAGQSEIEGRFAERFNIHSRQLGASAYERRFSYSASCATVLAARLCRLEERSVVLVEPCFDNIRHLILAEGLELHSISEASLASSDLLSEIPRRAAVWVVLPNNPTGFILDATQFASLCEAVAAKDGVLIADFAFRSYSEVMRSYDQYSIAAEAGVSLVGLEETGKRFSAHDLKVAMTLARGDSARTLYRLHDQLLLNVSPFVLTLLGLMIDEALDGGDLETQYLVKLNRQSVRELAECHQVLLPSAFADNVPMEILGTPPGVKGASMWRILRQEGVDVLPLQNYFWSNERSSHFDHSLRVPLNRDQSALSLGVSTLDRVFTKLREA